MNKSDSLLKSHLLELERERIDREGAASHRGGLGFRDRLRKSLGLPVPEDGDALRDAYRIHGDGVATARPEKLFKRESFKRSARAISGVRVEETRGPAR